ncbi:hypothetical protein [Streptomyces spinosus]|uniref:hypothetical protein n=1 Tax=Streptomyces spinosus TaxID=2872623 RepID=UPI001CEE06EC|nr:hypothetical protein [Streptomyces spinosus]
MAESDRYRVIHGEEDDGTSYTVTVPHTPWNDQLSNEQIVTSINEWMADGPQPTRERWPMPQPFSQWIDNTEPGPSEPCPDCGCWSLRLAAPPDQPAAEKRVVCTMVRCVASPLYRD